MAFPVMEASNTSSDNSLGTSSTITLPTGIESGDLVIAAISVGANVTVTWPSPWVELGETTSDFLITLSVGYLKATGGETSVTVTLGGSNLYEAHASYRWSGAADPDIDPPEIVMANHSSPAEPDPPALTPAQGAVDYQWIALMANDNGNDITSFPTGYVNLLEVRDGTSAGLGCGTRARNIATENPGGFVFAGNAASCSATVSIPPGPPVQIDAPVVNLDFGQITHRHIYGAY